MNRKESEQAYRDYVKQHVVDVQAVWAALQPLCTGEAYMPEAYAFAINAQIECHDGSKLGMNEFEGYRQWFYPAVQEMKIKADFDLAWNHHQKHNPHHWQYWIMWQPDESKVLPMPFCYIIEMLCDWGGMSVKFGDSPTQFYDKNKDTMLLHGTTKQTIGFWLRYVECAVAKVKAARAGKRT